MPKSLIATVLALGLVGSAPVFAQTASTDADRTIRQGDSIEWIALSGPPHRVRFGGTVGTTTLTSVSDVEKILEDFVSVTATGDTAQSPSGSDGETVLTAKVKADAAVGTTFIFTCGIHTSQMISQIFTIAASDAALPARTHRINGVQGLHWLLEIVKVEEVHADTTP